MHLSNREENTVKSKLTTGQNGLACTQLGGASATRVNHLAFNSQILQQRTVSEYQKDK